MSYNFYYKYIAFESQEKDIDFSINMRFKTYSSYFKNISFGMQIIFTFVQANKCVHWVKNCRFNIYRAF